MAIEIDIVDFAEWVKKQSGDYFYVSIDCPIARYLKEKGHSVLAVGAEDWSSTLFDENPIPAALVDPLQQKPWTYSALLERMEATKIVSDSST